jgi:hypothetical protein
MSAALVIQYATRMRHIAICCPAPLYNIFPHYLINGTIFEGVCVLIFSTILSEMFLVIRRIQRDMIVNVCRSSCKVPVIFDRFY